MIFVYFFVFRWSVNCWAGILGNRIIGPVFFEGALNGVRYLRFLQDELPGLIQQAGVPAEDQHWFQQDGAPPHWARAVRDHLDEVSFTNTAIYSPRMTPVLTPTCFYRFIRSGGLVVGGQWRGRPGHLT